MRHLLIILSLLLTATTFGQSGYNTRQAPPTFDDTEEKQEAAIGKPFPKFKVRDGDSVLTNDSLKGKVVFMNFWFEACPPCMAEMQGLNQLYDSLKDYKDFKFISFTYESPKRVEKIRAKYGIKYKIYSIREYECRQLNQGSGYPTNIILDKDQTVKHFQSGGLIDKDQATRYILDSYYLMILQELEQ